MLLQPDSAVLVRQLGDPSFVVREQAHGELSALGAAARTALESGLRMNDAEVRSRCRALLAVLRAAEHDVRLKAFLDNALDDLPGWKRYREVVAGAERGKFAELYRSNKDLLESVERDPKEAIRLLPLKATELKDRFLVSPKTVQQAEWIALLLVATDSRVRIDEPGYRTLLATIDIFTLWKDVREKAQNDAAARSILFAALNNLREPALQGDALALLARLEMREGLATAKRCLADRTLTPGTHALALLLIGKVGNKTNAADVLASLDDMGTLGQKTLRNKVLGAQVRDVALAMMIHLHGEEPAEFGFPYLNAIPGPLFGYAPTCFGFTNSTERDAAMQKWLKRNTGKN